MKYSSFNINHDQDQHSKRPTINGPRPSPLKIHKDSRAIHRPSDHNHHHHDRTIKKRQPVIIYTHSPKIIHTQARDFMALVQSLTGLSRDDHGRPKPSGSSSSSDDQSSSVSTDEIGRHDRNDDTKLGFGPYFADVPLFTPSVTELSFSPSIMEFMKTLPEY